MKVRKREKEIEREVFRIHIHKTHSKIYPDTGKKRERKRERQLQVRK